MTLRKAALRSSQDRTASNEQRLSFAFANVSRARAGFLAAEEMRKIAVIYRLNFELNDSALECTKRR